MDKKPHLVKWSTVCANKRNGGLGSMTFLISIGPFCVSEFGASQMKRMPYGGMSYAGSLGRSEEAGSLMLLEVLLEQASGRRLERNGI